MKNLLTSTLRIPRKINRKRKLQAKKKRQAERRVKKLNNKK